MQSLTSLDLLLLALAAVVIPAMSAVAGKRLALTPRNDLRLMPRYWLIVIRAIVVSLLVLFAWHQAMRPYTTLGLDVPIGYRGRVGLGIDGLLVCYFLVLPLFRKRPEKRLASMRQRLEAMRVLPRTSQEFLLFPVVAVVASVFEELLYRGYLMGVLEPVAGLTGAAVVSSALFGLGHVYQGPRNVLRTALIGLVFAVGYAVTRSLWWLMLAHVVFNLAGGLVAWRLARHATAPGQQASGPSQVACRRNERPGNQ